MEPFNRVSSAKSEPNVIWIMTDQQQAGAMGCLDASFHTPRLDELIATGVRFAKNICTSAQCSPSRASWMTGRYPHQVGVNQIGHILDPEEPNIARTFAESGYETVYFGKWHLGSVPLEKYGFQVVDYRTDGVDFVYAHSHHPNFWSGRDAVTTAKAVNYLEDHRDKTKPFFMTVSWYMPHPNAPENGPFELIEHFADRFPLEQMSVPDSFYNDDLTTKPRYQMERSQSDESRLTEDIVRRDAQKYRTMLALMDHNLGKLLDAVKRNGFSDNTIIVFTSDHGDMQGAHRLRLKGVLPYKELYETPLVFIFPQGNGNRQTIDDLVSSAAVPGTLLAAAGLPVPDCFEGGSLLPLLNQEKRDPESKVFFEHYKAYWGYHPIRGVQTEQWKYVYYYEEDMEEMYDLTVDPDELTNIAADSRVKAVKSELRKEVDGWWERTGALSRKPFVDESSPWISKE
jgi:arylsulfatase